MIFFQKKKRINRTVKTQIIAQDFKTGDAPRRQMKYVRNNRRTRIKLDIGDGQFEYVYVGYENIIKSPLDGEPMIWIDPVEINLTILRMFIQRGLLNTKTMKELKQLSRAQLIALFEKTHPLYWFAEMCKTDGIDFEEAKKLAEKHDIDLEKLPMNDLIKLVHDTYNTFLLRPYGDCADFVKTWQIDVQSAMVILLPFQLKVGIEQEELEFVRRCLHPQACSICKIPKETVTTINQLAKLVGDSVRDHQEWNDMSENIDDQCITLEEIAEVAHKKTEQSKLSSASSISSAAATSTTTTSSSSASTSSSSSSSTSSSSAWSIGKMFSPSGPNPQSPAST